MRVRAIALSSALGLGMAFGWVEAASSAIIADVTCTSTAIDLVTPAVDAQPDGAHVRASNLSGGPMTLRVGSTTADLPTFGTALVVQNPPGTITVSCFLPGRDASPDTAPSAPLTIADPNGYYDAEDLSCSKPLVRPPIDQTPVPQSELAAGARRAIAAAPSDVVSPAGYIGAGSPTMRVVRGKFKWALVRFDPLGDGTFVASGTRQCGRPPGLFTWWGASRNGFRTKITERWLSVWATRSAPPSLVRRLSRRSFRVVCRKANGRTVTLVEAMRFSDTRRLVTADLAVIGSSRPNMRSCTLVERATPSRRIVLRHIPRP